MSAFKQRIQAAFLALKAHVGHHKKLWAAIIALVIVLSAGYFALLSPPANFPSGNIVIISQGTSAPLVAKELNDAHVIKHPQLLQILLRVSGTGDRIQAGAYRFVSPQNMLRVAYRIVVGDYGIPAARVTFPEGTSVRDAAELVADSFPEISAADFLKAGKSYEGYLFPDTYLFTPSADSASIIKTMRANFDTKTAPLTADIRASGHSLADIITLASLVEKETRTPADRRIVAGILWDRLKLGMPLQVDAVFGYIYSRDIYSPSLADLKVASPYNTYLHVGLPPGPICNPGLDAITAALHPTKTAYLYYLTGKDGLMHYAATYAAHQANQRKYLN